MIFRKFALATAITFGLASSAHADAFNDMLMQLVEDELKSWIDNEDVIASIIEQNEEHAQLSESDITAMDQTWRGEIGSSNAPTINTILDRPVSRFLQTKKDQLDGLVSEVFLMDNKGLNVAQSDVTSDYWQGDEAKFQETYGKGSGAIHIADIELDESTGTYQTQVSITIEDPENGAPIGAVTFGINVDLLQQ